MAKTPKKTSSSKTGTIRVRIAEGRIAKVKVTPPKKIK